MCMEMKTIPMPSAKLSVSLWPKSTADMSPVKIVANVLENFFRIVSESGTQRASPSIIVSAWLRHKSHSLLWLSNLSP